MQASCTGLSDPRVEQDATGADAAVMPASSGASNVATGQHLWLMRVATNATNCCSAAPGACVVRPAASADRLPDLLVVAL